MKIGIITLPLFDNYGGILQNFALQNILKKLGHIPETIESKYPCSKWLMPFIYARRTFLKFIRPMDVHIFYENWCEKNPPTHLAYIKAFIDKYLSIKHINYYNDIKQHDYNAYIVGSDQIWRPKYVNSHIFNVYLSFTKKWKNIKRIAYAVSFGVDNWEYNKQFTWKCRQLAQKFDAISVREKSGIALCNDYLNVKTQYVLDPTMLLSADDYRQLMPTERTNCPGELFSYILDDSKENQAIVQQLEDKFNYQVFYASSYSKTDPKAPKNTYKAPVEHWLQGFDDAKFVITDSFHACVFSILFSKPFIVIGNPKRGLSRIHSLLSIFGLEHHLLIKGTPIDFNQDYTLNTESIHKILNEKREISMNFLYEHLK